MAKSVLINFNRHLALLAFSVGCSTYSATINRVEPPDAGLDGGVEIGGKSSTGGAATSSSSSAPGGATSTGSSASGGATDIAGATGIGAATGTGGPTETAGNSSTGGVVAVGGLSSLGGTYPTGSAGIASAATGGTSAIGGAATGGTATAGGASSTGGVSTTGVAATTGGFPGDTLPPTILHIAPADGATGVTSDSTVEITFSEAMNQSSVRNGLSVSGVLPGSLNLAWNAAGTTLTITPSTGLSYNTGTDLNSVSAKSYTVLLSTVASDLSGNPLESTFTSTFATLRKISQTVVPTVDAHYDSLGLALGDAIEICPAGSIEAYRIGTLTSSSNGSTWYGVFSFENVPVPSSIYDLSSAGISGTQTPPDPLTFYSDGGSVLLQESSTYMVLAPTGMKPLRALPWVTIGTFATAYEVTTSVDITSTFAPEIADGTRSFLFQLTQQNGGNGEYANYECSTVKLALVYLVP